MLSWNIEEHLKFKFACKKKLLIIIYFKLLHWLFLLYQYKLTEFLCNFCLNNSLRRHYLFFVEVRHMKTCKSIYVQFLLHVRNCNGTVYFSIFAKGREFSRSWVSSNKTFHVKFLIRQEASRIAVSRGY